MPYDWPTTANHLADLMRLLKECRPERVGYVRSKIRRFLESHGCHTVPWVDGRTIRDRATDAAHAPSEEEGAAVEQSEGERIIFLGFNGDSSSTEATLSSLGLSNTTAGPLH